MDKAHILAEIKRTATANGGTPLGRARFAAETGIKESDWSGRYWARWGDAIREAGFVPNKLQSAYEHMDLLEKYARMALELGRLPTTPDLRMKGRQDMTFPSHNTFQRLGKKAELVARLREFCKARGGYEEVVQMCDEYAPRTAEQPDAIPRQDVEIGFIYLIKSGRFYKIGRSNAVGRREYELALQLPELATTIHVIRTDDPVGIEAYWHNRFAAKRKNGEWFDLDKADIAAFKRRKFM